MTVLLLTFDSNFAFRDMSVAVVSILNVGVTTFDIAILNIVDNNVARRGRMRDNALDQGTCNLRFSIRDPHFEIFVRGIKFSQSEQVAIVEPLGVDCERGRAASNSVLAFFEAH